MRRRGADSGSSYIVSGMSVANGGRPARGARLGDESAMSFDYKFSNSCVVCLRNSLYVCRSGNLRVIEVLYVGHEPD